MAFAGLKSGDQSIHIKNVIIKQIDIMIASSRRDSRLTGMCTKNPGIVHSYASLAANNDELVTPAGFEPATCPLGGGCSIQLSHGAAAVLLTADPRLGKVVATSALR